MTVVTRFAPSPTGYLHIGGARTALFNWLYARHHGGRFLLRIEDTDRQRSTQAAIDAIIDGLSWLGLEWDGEVVHQFARAAAPRRGGRASSWPRARPITAIPRRPSSRRCARPRAPRASPCAMTGAGATAIPPRRPKDVAPVIRLKMPQSGETVVADEVQGEVRVGNEQLDDMVLLRADGTPVYMLSVVVDDHDMDITHVIRGDDHLTNTFRQVQLYDAMGWAEAELRPCSHDPWPRRRQALEAPWRAGRRGLSRDGLSARRPCATICCGWAGPMAMTRSSRPRRRSPGSISTASAARPPASISPS